MFTNQKSKYLLNLGIHVKTCLCSNFSTNSLCSAKQGLAMRKLMGYNKKKRRLYIEQPLLPSPSSVIGRSEESKPSVDPKRVRVLNKIFMRYVTDLMASGERASEFLGHGIEISKVKITPNYKGLNVFWIAKGDYTDTKVETLLNKNAGYLRHELSTLRVIGEIPKITFIKDTHYAQIMEIDRRLSVADFGEDHEPTEITTKLKSQLELHLPLDVKIRAAIGKLDESHSEDHYAEEPLPAMPQNVFGLNYDIIMNRITKAMDKTKAVHRLSSQDEDPALNVPKIINKNNVISYISNKEQREAFKEFLRKREILRTKAKKNDKNIINELLTTENYDENGYFHHYENNYNEDEDFIDIEDEKYV